MAQYKGDSRDGKRAQTGARVQKEMKEAFDKKINEMRLETEKSMKTTELSHMFAYSDLQN